MPRRRYNFETEAGAAGWLADAKAAIANGRPVPEPRDIEARRAGNITLRQACTRAFDQEWAQLKSDWPATVELYLNAFCRYFGDTLPLREIDAAAVARYSRSLAGQAQSTINAKLSTLGKLLKWGQREGHLVSVPEIKKGKVRNARLSFLAIEEEQRIVALMRQWEKHAQADAVIALVDTGLRPSELWRLEARDLDRGAKTLAVRQSKNGDGRIVPVTSRVLTILQRRADAYLEGPLWPEGGNRWLRHTWDAVREALGKDDDKEFVIYILRHTCATRMVRAGVPLGLISRWLGHRSIQMTMRYAKFATEDYKDAVKALEAATQPALEAATQPALRVFTDLRSGAA